MIEYFKICELDISIDSTDIGLIKNYFEFQSEPSPKLDLSIICSKVNTISKPIGDVLINDQVRWVDMKKEQLINISIIKENVVLTSMNVNYTWNHADIKYLNNGNEWEWKRTSSLFEILFRNCLIFNNGIVIHASAIEWQGKSIIFTAPAGTGKTTQSNLWKDYMGAKVINGDRPAIRISESEIFAYGTPWSGSSKEYINTKVPVSAIILLEQSPVCEIEQLNKMEALKRIIPRFFLPYNDKKMMELSMNTIERILQHTPVYLFKCTPDKQAVDVLYNAIL